MGFVHGVSSSTPVGAGDARHVARVMSALATPSRVRILGRLREGPCAVGELALAVQMEQPAVSHQLRILRDLGLVVGTRSGRNTVYALYDGHVKSLLDEALRHLQHLRAGHTENIRAETSAHQPKARGDNMTEHTHDNPHAHAHEPGDVAHDHPHTSHEHGHVEHEHQHGHDGESHAHPHVHQDGQEDDHQHSHA